MAAARVAAAALQYSKWLSRFICWVWALYRFGVLFASVVEPNSAEALASTLVNLDWIMLVNEGTYLINSLGEKYIFSDKFILQWINKGGFKSMFSRLSKLNNAINDEDKDESEEDETASDEPEEDNG